MGVTTQFVPSDAFLCPALAEHTVFVMSVRNGSRRVRSQRKSVDWGTMGPALGGAYECYAHISSFHSKTPPSTSNAKNQGLWGWLISTRIFPSRPQAGLQPATDGMGLNFYAYKSIIDLETIPLHHMRSNHHIYLIYNPH